MRIILGSIFDRAGRALVAAGAVVCAIGAFAESGVYQAPEVFIEQAFPGGAPAARALWLRADLRAGVSKILGRAPAPRVRYWERDGTTVWVLEEIGKDKPITAGVVVHDGAIENVEVLVFRESRGWEVKYPFFTRQFQDVRLTAGRELDQSIDGITGATLSVRAMTRMARMALFLDAHTRGTATELATAR